MAWCFFRDRDLESRTRSETCATAVRYNPAMFGTSDANSDSSSASIRQRSYYMILVWAEQSKNANRTWRGYIETSTRQRAYFKTLAELDRLLQAWSGWQDPPEPEAVKGLSE